MDKTQPRKLVTQENHAHVRTGHCQEKRHLLTVLQPSRNYKTQVASPLYLHVRRIWFKLLSRNDVVLTTRRDARPHVQNKELPFRPATLFPILSPLECNSERQKPLNTVCAEYVMCKNEFVITTSYWAAQRLSHSSLLCRSRSRCRTCISRFCHGWMGWRFFRLGRCRGSTRQ